MSDFKPRRARIVFQGKQTPDGPWWTDGEGHRVCVSTCADPIVRGVVFGCDKEEIAAEIKRQYPRVYEWTVSGLENQRLDYELIFGMAPADCKFADSIYA